ncbi:MAG: hypothetical protein KatS3mg057_1072 [Herpetosiphonaceae bacterium]|nr:MAG: hypothetical protein KatS3mg057_1072 [Herpetosiphonaceae bacterium]
MLIGSCRIELFLPTSHSLKEKRSVIKSIIARLRNEFNIAIAEVDEHEVWQRAVLGVACVSAEASHAQEQLQAVVNWIIDNRPDVQLLTAESEIL